jgi:conjugative transfer region lipoprotein (TIGR03751 family)
VLGGCATSKEELLTHSDRTMMDIWQQETGGDGGGTGQVAAPAVARRAPEPAPAADRRRRAGRARRADALHAHGASEVYRQFQRLPNPDLVMYVYPHLAGTDPVPVPGYTTVFPLYQRVQYAMPGERVEDY